MLYSYYTKRFIWHSVNKFLELKVVSFSVCLCVIRLLHYGIEDSIFAHWKCVFDTPCVCFGWQPCIFLQATSQWVGPCQSNRITQPPPLMAPVPTRLPKVHQWQRPPLTPLPQGWPLLHSPLRLLPASLAPSLTLHHTSTTPTVTIQPLHLLHHLLPHMCHHMWHHMTSITPEEPLTTSILPHTLGASIPQLLRVLNTLILPHHQEACITLRRATPPTLCVCLMLLLRVPPRHLLYPPHLPPPTVLTPLRTPHITTRNTHRSSRILPRVRLLR